jgi:tRNA G10  N-methylase Trm11
VTVTEETGSSAIQVLKEYEELVPRMTPQEYKELKEDIKENGLDRAIVVTQNYVVLDGHHRFKICKELGITDIKHEVKHFDTKLDEKIYVVSTALLRRQLDPWDRDNLVLKRKDFQRQKYELSEEGRKKIEEANKQRSIQKSLEGQLEQFSNKSTPANNVGWSSKSTRRKYHSDKKTYERKTRQASKRNQTTEYSLSKTKYVNEMVAKYPDKKLEIGYDNRTYKQLQQALNLHVMKLHKAYSEIKQDQELILKKAEAARAAKELRLPKKVTLLNMDIAKVTEEIIKDNSVDLILTDPPYGTDALPLYKSLAELASKKLKEGGSLVFYFGQYQLPEILKVFSSEEYAASDLKYWWMFAVKHESDDVTNMMYTQRVRVQWKPLLWFVKGDNRLGINYVRDFIQSSTPDKTKHHWAQSQTEAWYIIENLTVSEDSLVVDPFLGSGAFAVPAIKLGRYFIGVEKETQVYERAKGYIAQETAAIGAVAGEGTS